MKVLVKSGSELSSIYEEYLHSYADAIGLDTETNGLHVIRDSVCGFSFSILKDNMSWYVPVKHKQDNIDFDSAKQFLLNLSSRPLNFHHALFDMSMVFRTFGVKLSIADDTMAMAYVLNEESNGLKELAYQYFGYQMVKWEELMLSRFGRGWFKKGYRFDDLTPVEAYEYACDDPFYTLKLLPLLKAKLDKFQMQGIYNLEKFLIPVIEKINFTGVPIDVALLKQASERFAIMNAEREKAIYQLAGHTLKINSPKEVAALLFGELQLPVIRRSGKTGVPSADAEVLEVLEAAHPIVPLIATWRSHSRLATGYSDKIPKSVESNGKIYTSFHSIGAISGRLTSSSEDSHDGEAYGVNFQNIALRSFELTHKLPFQLPCGLTRDIVASKQPLTTKLIQELGLVAVKVGQVNSFPFDVIFDADIRSAFIPPNSDFDWLKADYSQIEYRMMASLSQERCLIDGFNAGIDFHKLTASVMLRKPLDQVTDEDRQLGKILNFGMSYGMTAYTLAKRTGMSEAEAEQKYAEYFARLPELLKLIAHCKEFAKVNGYIRTFFGRRRYFNIKDLPPQIIGKILRKSFNTLIQGSSADILKLAMIRVAHRIKKFGADVQLLLTVHDELDFVIRKSIWDEACAVIKKAMEIPVPSNWAKIVVDFEVGESWSPHDLNTYVVKNPLPSDEFVGWGELLKEFNNEQR